MRIMSDRYAYLGPEGTFTEAALAAFDAGAPPDAVPCPSIQAALDAVRAGDAERAIVPIENSVEGGVTATLDDLATGADLVIAAELLLPVTFALLAREGTALAGIKTVGGHPQAQPQCRKWLAAHLPAAEWRAAPSNAEVAVRGVNLTRIESRPTGDRLGQYCFSIDCEGHIDDARVGEALMGLRRVCAGVTFLGSYPRQDTGPTHVRPGTSDGEFAQATAWLARLRYGRV